MADDDLTAIPIDDDPPAELDPLGVSRGQGDQTTVERLKDIEAQQQ